MSPLPDDLRIGADVFSKDGHRVGELRRLVLRRSDLALTHLVVDIGFLRSGRPLWQGGFGLDYDRVVGFDAVTAATDERIELALTAEEFLAQPEYSAERFEEPHDVTPHEFDIPDIANRLGSLASRLINVPDAWLVERLNRPLDSVDIREGTPVWRVDPHEKLGEVDRVVLDPQTGRARAFVIRRGFLLHRDVLLPVRYVTEILDDLSVRVDISDADLEQLREYQD